MSMSNGECVGLNVLQIVEASKAHSVTITRGDVGPDGCTWNVSSGEVGVTGATDLIEALNFVAANARAIGNQHGHESL